MGLAGNGRGPDLGICGTGGQQNERECIWHLWALQLDWGDMGRAPSVPTAVARAVWLRAAGPCTELSLSGQLCPQSEPCVKGSRPLPTALGKF